MVKKILRIGFTDELNENSYDLNPDIENMYQLLDEDPNTAKECIEWRLVDDIDASLRIINRMEKILNTAHTFNILIRHNVEQEEYSHTIEFKNLFPIEDSGRFVDDDYLAFTNKFNNPGDIYILTAEAARAAGYDEEQTYEYAARTNDFSKFSNHDYSVISTIDFDFDRKIHHPLQQKRWQEIMDQRKIENQEAIKAAGFELDHPKLTPGELKIATLLTDYETAYNTINMYSKICNIEIVEE